MGVIKTRILLSNPKDNVLSPIEVDAIVDTGALHLCIPEHVALQLQLAEMYKREVTVADGRRTLCSYVGPIQVNFGNRGCALHRLQVEVTRLRKHGEPASEPAAMRLGVDAVENACGCRSHRETDARTSAHADVLALNLKWHESLGRAHPGITDVLALDRLHIEPFAVAVRECPGNLSV